MGTMCVWGIEVDKLSGKPHLRNRGSIVAAQLMPIDGTFKQQWLYFTDYFILLLQQAAAAKSLQSCPTLCDPIDSSPPGSPIPGILYARTLEWVAISFSSAWKWKVKGKSLSHFQLLATPWTAAYQPPPSMGFSRQEYWSGVPLPSLCQWAIPSYSVSHFLPVSFLNCLCPWKSSSNVSASTLYQHALLSDDICISYSFFICPEIPHQHPSSISLMELCDYLSSPS